MSKRKQAKGQANLKDNYLLQNNKTLKLLLDDLAKFPPLKRKEQLELIKAAQTGDADARQKVSLYNCRLVLKIAGEFQYPNLEILDLIQEGYIGLDLAIDKFDLNRKVPFANFAAWWIKTKILKFIERFQKIVRLPNTQHLAINKLNKIKAEFIRKNDREPSFEELKEISGLTHKMISNYYNLYNKGDLAVSQNLDTFKVKNIDDAKESLEEQVDNKWIKESLELSLKELNEEDQRFIQDLYGIDCQRHTFKEISEKYGITHLMMKRKELKILKKLRISTSSNFINIVQ
jgi:RNA polymerase sigma factor, sigma-70 family